MKYRDIEKYKRRELRCFQIPKSIIKAFDRLKEVETCIADNKPFYMLGVKNTDYITDEVIKKLQSNNYFPFSIDKMSRGGRAVDIDLINPITGKVMTGSSSGTAINVLEDINDIGLGTDGGGSVLAPAMSLNLYGIISPLFYRDETYIKKSTDGISFVPSLGFISKDIKLIKQTTRLFIPETVTSNIRVVIPKKGNIILETGRDVNETISSNLSRSGIEVEEVIYPNIFGDRQPNISFLSEMLNKYDVILSYEGPIDYYGFGDSVFGLFNDVSRNDQEKSMKGLIRVVNMVEASALVVPANDFSSGYVIIAKSTQKGLQCLFEIETKLTNKLSNTLYDRYFTI